MEHLNDLLKIEPFSYDFKKRKKVFFNAVIESFKHHFDNSYEFRKWSIYNKIDDYKKITSLYDMPYFPNNIFKHYNLTSEKKEFKIINSSGTTSQIKSKINLDRENARRQTLILSKILSNILGKKRKPFLIVDKGPNQESNNYELSARFAGLSGYLLAASKKNYLLTGKNNDLDFDIKRVKKMLDLSMKLNEGIVVIGYTYLIYEKLLSILNNSSDKIKFPKNTTLIHFGGWKKIKDKKISKKDFNLLINKNLGIKDKNIIDIYGFSEQLGTVYPSRGRNGCRVPAYSEVIVRSVDNMRPVKDGEIGFLQFISPIPTSYPGLSILNDDLGRIILRDKNNIEFEIIGRPENSTPRGCGDTLPENFLFTKK